MKKYLLPLMIFTFAAVLVGCKSMPILDQFIAQPTLSVDQFSLSESSFLNQTFKVRLKVDNPNSFSLPILSLNYGLNVAGVEVAQGDNEKNVTIPAGGSEFLDLNINTNLLKSLPDLKSVLRSGGKDITYGVTGKVKTDHALVKSIPFQKTGVFQLSF